MAGPKIKTVQVDGKVRYRFVVGIGPDPVTGKRRQKTRSHNRRKDAQAALAKTARNYHDALRPVRERLGAVPLQKLTVAHIEDMVDWQMTSGRKRGGNRVFLGSLASECLHAVMLLSLLGLRPAEVCGLRWADVDLDADTLRVELTRTLVASDTGMVVVEKGPKSASGRRTLALPPQVTTALKPFKATQAAEKLRAGPAYQDSGYVLVDELGAPSGPTGYDAAPIG